MILRKLVNKNVKFIKYLYTLICLLVSFIIPSNTVYAVDYIDVESPSLINWGLDAETLTEGYYNVTVEDITYPIHLYVFEGDQIWSSNMTFGDADDIGTSTTNAKNSVFVIVKGNLTIESGVTVTAYGTSYGGPKGLFLFVNGTLINNGTISMTARGAKAVGEKVYLWKNMDDSYEYIPATGGTGGAAIAITSGTGTVRNGNSGGNGSNRQTGGGGTGAGRRWTRNAYISRGGIGTSYSGGSGSGAANSDGGGGCAITSGAGSDVGGAGGKGVVCSSNGSGYGQISIGGTGNPTGAYSTYRETAKNYVKREGTGGLLVLYSGSIQNNGTISANGVSSSSASRSNTNGRVDPGGASGGGSVNIFYGMLDNSGSITATGGAAITGEAGARGGAGGAGTVTTTQLVLEEEFLHPTLSNLEVTNQTIYPSFDSKTYNYGVTLDSETSTVNIKANVTHDENSITSGIGDIDIPIGSSTHNVVVTSKIGIIQIYSIDFYRPPSGYKYLKDITINGNSIENFEPKNLTYNINLPYNSDLIELDIIKGRTSQEVFGTGNINLNSGNNKIILTVISEDGNYTINYTLNIFREHSSKLKSITIDDYELDPIFDSEINTYTITIMSTQLSLNVNVVPYDEEAGIKLSGFGYIKSSQKGTITITEPNSSQTTYTINIIKEGIPLIDEYTYSYKGEYQTFVAPAMGFYKIELWGAQGGNSAGNNSRACSYGRGNAYGGGCGGFGAYTSGVIKLNKGDTLYIYVGQRGLNGWASHDRPGGWNGGGSSTYDHSDNEASGSGGGATDIRLVPTSTPNTWNEFDSLKSRIMVAAGGGGGSDVYPAGNGGTLKSRATRFSSIATQTTGYAFGYGENYVYRRGNIDVAGGGSGYFGGYSTAASSSNYGNYGQTGTGGSSFVSGCDGCVAISEESTSQKDIKFSDSNVHYSGYKFDEISMIEGGTSMPSTGTGYSVGNVSNGYARITLINKSENNFLSNIQVKTTNFETEEVTTRTYTPDFNMEVEDYYINVGPTETIATLSARPEDSTAKISGIGNVDVLAGENVYEIEVTAENGNIKTYKVHITREASTKSYPKEVTVSGLVPSLCIQSDSFCKISPEKFDENTNTYYLTIPSRIKQLWFDVKKGHPYQKVIGEGKVGLTGGDNLITIEITSEDGKNISTYTYAITRDMTGNTDLSKLEIIDPLTELNYDPDITEYYISIPNEYTKINEFNVETDDENASYIITGNEDFNVGMNQVNIVVTASNGEIKTYIINVYREKSGNTYLTNIEVKDDINVYELTPEFNKVNVGAYKVTIPNNVKNVYVNANVEADTSVLVGTGKKELKTGINKYELTVTAEDGSIEIYKLEITREKNNNNNLTSIEVKNGEKIYNLTPVFDSSNLEYNVTLDEGISTITISAVPEVNTTTYKLLDGTAVKLGNNKKRIMAIAEDGTTKTYTINLYRPASSNNYLKDINLSAGTLSPNFDKEESNYEVELDNNVSTFTITGIKDNALAKVYCNGKYSLNVGSNEITITVTSETGEVRSYNLNVIRKPNSNANLSMITTNVGILTPEFMSEELEYKINVENTIDTITILGTPEVSTTKVNGNGTYSLVSGENQIILTTLAEDKVTSKTYKIIVTKDKSDNDNIKNIILEEGKITPEFNPNILEYKVNVPNEILKGTFHVELEDEKASYEIIGNDNFIVGENIVKIIVTSESGETKEYEITITRQEVGVSSNYLSSLEIDNGILTPAFDKNKLFYEVVVPYEISNVNLSATLEDTNASLKGTGNYNLVVGKNLLQITVTGVDGKTRDYQIVITREKNTDTRLSELSIEGVTLSTSFDKDTFTYNLSTTEKKLIFTKIKTLDEKASYEIIGNLFEENKDYQVIIRVTAQNQITTNDYILNVTKKPSNNNNLNSLSVTGYNITPQFNKSTTLYTLTVPNDVNSIYIEATTENDKATISGDKSQMLVVGENQLVIEVTSESGMVKAYTIIVTREKNGDNSLSNLIVNNGSITPEFKSDVLNYNVTVPYSETELDLTVILKEGTSSYRIENNNLKVGTNTVSVVVTAENGNTKTYTINVIREDIVSALLENLEVKNYEISPEFNSYVNSYDVTVDYEITSLDLLITTLDKKASYEVIGNSDFNIGTNIVTINVTSRDSSMTESYVLNVNRQSYSNSFLDYLYTSLGDVNPVFNKNTLTYTLEVPNHVTTIELFAEAIDKSTTVTGIGEHNLQVGENILPITVTTTSSIKRTYFVIVTRSGSTDNYLENLTVKNGNVEYSLSPEFSKEVNQYSTTVNTGTKSVLISAVYNKTATVNGLGTKSLTVGENVVNINVTSESGEVNTYTITINRPASNNNYLTDLVPNVGSLEPNFSYEELNYTLNLDSSSSLLYFDAITEDENAIVDGEKSKVISDGTSLREIIVTAEDGSKRTYTITVNKERSDNAKLSSLSVEGYTLDEEFSSDLYEYHLTVPNSKKTITPNEVITVTSDKNATVQKDSTLTLSTKEQNEYIVTVIAKDGFTKQDYKIIITREKGNNSLLSNLSVKKGELSPNFSPTNNTYKWTVRKGQTVSNSDLIITLSDINSNVATSDAMEIINMEGNIFEINVISENGLSNTTYSLDVTYDLSSDATLKDLVISDGKLSPEFNPEIEEYNLYEYIDTDIVTIEGVPSVETSVVTGTGDITLDSDEKIVTIMVTAEDGSEKVYTINIHKNILIDEELKNIYLDGLDTVECLNDNCKLTPKFTSENTSYSIKVPYEYTILDLKAETINNQQTTKILVNNELANNYKLPVGKTNVTVEVYDGMENKTKEYLVIVERCKSSNSYLKSLEITGFDIGEFERTKQEYFVNVNNVDEVEVKAVPEDEDAIVYINGYNYLLDGNNDVVIKVTASNGSIREYIIHVIKDSLDYNNYLRSLVISSGVIYDLSPKFNKAIMDYKISVENSITKINIDAIADEETSSLVGAGERELSEGNNKFEIIVTAITGEVRTYNLNVIRELGSNAFMSSLTINNGDMSPNFVKNKYEYNVSVEEDIKTLDMDITLEDPTASYEIVGNEKLETGENKVIIKVTSEDRSVTRKYTLLVNKKGSSNNYLSMIKLNEENIPDFDREKLNYNIEVENDIKIVELSSIRESLTSSVIGDGVYSLNEGYNTLSLLVISESNDSRIYTINIYRKYNNYLSAIVTDRGDVIPEFNKEITNYSITVENKVDNITVIGMKADSNATVKGNGKYDLDIGDNNIQIIVIAADNTEKKYNINVIRDSSNNNYLTELSIGEGVFDKKFNKEEQNYTTYISNEYDSVSIYYEKKDMNANVEIIGNENLVLGNNEIIVRVTASNGNVRDYIINVVRQDVALFSNYLTSLTVNKGTLNPIFEKEIIEYVVTVEDTVGSIYITGVRESNESIVNGFGTHTLNDGRNEIPITVTSKDNKIRTYKVIVYKVGSNEARLSNLMFEEGTITPVFNKNVFEYNMTVGSNINKLTELLVTPVDSRATVEIIGADNLSSNTNKVIVRVIAADTITTLDYVITVTKEVNSISRLLSLSSNIGTLSPVFNKYNNGTYIIRVNNNVQSIILSGEKEHENSTVEGLGLYNLEVGSNFITVSVTSETGNVTTYSLNVIRDLSSNNYLSNLGVKNYDITPNYNKEINDYTLNVPTDVSSVNIYAVAEDENSVIEGIGQKTIDYGDNLFKIVVTSASGVVNTYTITINREYVESAKILNMSVEEGEFTQRFDKDIFNYDVYIPNEKTFLTFNIELEDKNSSYEIIGNENFDVGNNEVQIMVKSKSGTVLTYVVNAVRQISSNNYLKSIKLSEGVLIPTFDKYQLNYNVELDDTVDIVNIISEAENINSIITGNGNYNLEKGNNIIKIKVLSESNVERVYTINIVRKYSDNNLLSDLSVSEGELNPTFDPITNVYRVDVTSDIEIINISATAEDENAIVTGFGKKNLSSLENTFEINVTSESGIINTYKLIVTRMLSNDLTLLEFKPDSGILDKEYSDNINEYILNVDYNTSVVNMKITPTDNKTTVNGDKLIMLTEVKTVIQYEIIAEDGSLRKITLTINKEEKIVDIILNKSNFVLVEGSEEDIVATISPSSIVSNIIYETENTDIISIDNMGHMIALKKGVTTIKVYAEKDPTIVKVVNVEVLSKELISNVYQINRKDYTYIIGMEEGITLREFVSNLENESSTIKLYDKEGNSLTNMEDIVKTGLIVKLEIENKEYDSAILIVRGDINEDGVIDVSDKVKLVNHILLKDELKDYRIYACDLVVDDIVDVSDKVKLVNYILKKITSLN